MAIDGKGSGFRYLILRRGNPEVIIKDFLFVVISLFVFVYIFLGYLLRDLNK